MSLDQRTLNRTLLLRQGLLERSDVRALDMIEQLVGMQAQVPANPYLALWWRVRDFRPGELSTLIAERGAVRAQLMRATIHLVSARDCLAIHPITQPVAARAFKSPWSGRLADAGRRRDRGRGPRAAGRAAAYARGARRGARPALARRRPFRARARRDLFGPATVADVRTWSGLTGLREVVARLRPQLRTFRDEHGRELLDAPDAPLADAATPAPPRFLPEYDNVLLSHADRARVLDGHGPGLPFARGSAIGTLLVDGFYRANWKIAHEDATATLTVDRFNRLPDDGADVVDEIAAEAAGLLAFVAPQSAERRVAFVPSP